MRNSKKRFFLSAFSLLLALTMGCAAPASSGHSLQQYAESFTADSEPLSVYDGDSDSDRSPAAPDASSAPAAESGSESSSSPATPTPAVTEAYRYGGKATGFLLTLDAGGDVDAAALTDAQLQDKLDAAVDYAAAHDLHTIYLKVRYGAKTLYPSAVFDRLLPDCGFDVVEYLCVSAAAQQVQVIAVADTLSAAGSGLSASNPAAKYAATLLSGETKFFNPGNADTAAQIVSAAAELAAYPVAGLLLDALDLYGVDSPASYTSGVSALVKAVKAAVGALPVGILFDGVEPRTVTADSAAALASAGTVSALYPRSYSGVDYYYTANLNRWINALGDGTSLYTVNAAYKVTSQKFSSRELLYQTLINSTRSAVDGVVFESYADLLSGAVDFSEVAGVIAESSADIIYTSTDTSFAQSLAVCFPPKSTYTTTASAIYVMGTSNPGSKLTLNGSEVARQGYKGCFGVKVDLAMGDNVLTFKNGDSTAKVTITRNTAGASSTISAITAASRFPAADVGIVAGEAFSFTCVGPAGAEITAKIGGSSVEMKQVVAGASTGIAATYKGTVTLSASGSISELGKVTYTLRYKGDTTSYTSAGKVYVVSSAAGLAVKVTDYHGNVLSDPTVATSIVGTMKLDSIVSFDGCVVNAGKVAYKLADGNYITSDAAAFYPKVFTPSYTVSGGSVSASGRDEYIRLKTGSPGFKGGVTSTLNGNTLTVRFYDGKVTGTPNIGASSYVSGVSAGSFDGGGTLVFTLSNADALWGYNIEYDADGNISVHFRGKPHLSSAYGKPLSGVVIMLDPGHSGEDPGALGVAYNNGPSELTMNLAISRATKYRLELLGATVYMTHTGNEGRVQLSERMQATEKVMPDLFLSLHHNSAATTKDHTSSNWMEAYYYYSGSKQFALNLLDSVRNEIGRSVKAAYKDAYYVTRITYAPAVLFEVGFVINPVNYEDCTSTVTIYKTACAIADAVMETIPS